jgi:hypothetical protein
MATTFAKAQLRYSSTTIDVLRLGPVSMHPKPFDARQTGMMMAKNANQWLPIIRQVWWRHALGLMKSGR